MLDGSTVEQVQGRAEALHIGILHRTPLQHGRQQGVKPSRFSAEGGNKLGTEKIGFEFVCRHVGEEYVIQQLDPLFRHSKLLSPEGIFTISI